MVPRVLTPWVGVDALPSAVLDDFRTVFQSQNKLKFVHNQVPVLPRHGFVLHRHVFNCRFFVGDEKLLAANIWNVHGDDVGHQALRLSQWEAAAVNSSTTDTNTLTANTLTLYVSLLPNRFFSTFLLVMRVRSMPMRRSWRRPRLLTLMTFHSWKTNAHTARRTQHAARSKKV